MELSIENIAKYGLPVAFILFVLGVFFEANLRAVIEEHGWDKFLHRALRKLPLLKDYKATWLVMGLLAGGALVSWIWPALVPGGRAEISNDHTESGAKGQKATAEWVQPSYAITLCTDGPCIPVRLKPGPEYFKGFGLGTGGVEPLILNGISAVTTDRLRVFVDYSEYRSGWMEKARATIGEIKEPVKGRTEHLQLIYYQKDRPNAGQNALWWGEPSKEQPVVASTFSGSPLPAILVRARLAIVGPEGEQHYYFLLVRGGENIGTGVGVIQQHELGDWITEWESEK
jgi:hypothetical protein